MPEQPTPEIELLRAAYAAFNAHDIDAALALMTPDVAWTKAFKGGFVRGPEAAIAGSNFVPIREAENMRKESGYSV